MGALIVRLGLEEKKGADNGLSHIASIPGGSGYHSKRRLTEEEKKKRGRKKGTC